MLERPVTDAPYGRGGVVVDPDGHRWMVSREARARGSARTPATWCTRRCGRLTSGRTSARSSAGPRRGTPALGGLGALGTADFGGDRPP